MATIAVQAQLHTAAVHSPAGDLNLSSGGKIMMSLPGASEAVTTRVDAGDTIVDTGSKALNLVSNTLDSASDVTEHAAPTEVVYMSGSASGAKSTIRGTETDALAGTQGATSSAVLETTTTSAKVSNAGTHVQTVGDRVDLRADTHEMKIGGATILTIAPAKTVISADVDIQGSLTTVDAAIGALRIQDPNVKLAHGTKEETAIADGATGIAIQTVPGAPTDGVYMSGFKASDGSALFWDGTVVDADLAQASGAFDKHLSFRVGDGSRVLGARTSAARSAEPAWDVSGGSVRLNHTVAAADGTAKQFAVRLRVSDDGTFEVLRETTQLAWNDATSAYAATSAPTIDVLQAAVVTAAA